MTAVTATGYAQLQMWRQAWDELEKLPADARTTDEALNLSLGVLVGLKRYEAVVTLAEEMVRQGAESQSARLMGAYAIRLTRSVEEAKAFLMAGEEVLKYNASFHYQLAVYESQMRKVDEARRHLNQALTLNPDLRETALEDEDLESMPRSSLP